MLIPSEWVPVKVFGSIRAVSYRDKRNSKDQYIVIVSSKRITSNDYDKKCQELKNKQYDINERIKKYLKADENFKLTVNTILSIASKAYEIFESSNIDQKRKLINYVFSNLRLNGLTLEYDLKKPFDQMVDCQTHSEWLGLLYTLRTPTYYKYLSIDNTIFQE